MQRIKQKSLLITLVFMAWAYQSVQAAADTAMEPPSQAEALNKSLVHIEASIYSYNPLYPWRHTDLTKQTGYGCAVGEYEVLTTAYNVADAKFITIRRFGQNEQIEAKVKVADYESNLCLLELDHAKTAPPLQPVIFSELYNKGAGVEFYWFDKNGQVYNGRGYIDRIELYRSPLSFGQFINIVAGNVSQQSGLGHLFCHNEKIIGLGCWYNKDINESGIIPAVVINKFLRDVLADNYKGFAMPGFTYQPLLDPAIRAYLKMPSDLKDGVYVTDVNTVGTGSDTLKQDDVILAIDGATIDAHGKFEDSRYKRISFIHLITSKDAGDKLAFDIWRQGERQQIQIEARTFKATDMLVPFYEYDRQSQYIVVGGFVLQQLSCKYLKAWGSDWQGKADPHLYHYFNDMGFKSSDERKDIVILSLVLPAEINLGYQSLRQMVVSKYNGIVIRSMADITKAQASNPEAEFDIIELENDNPTIVIPRSELPQADALIASRYGIEQMKHIN
jgi:hypothetical protein